MHFQDNPICMNKTIKPGQLIQKYKRLIIKISLREHSRVFLQSFIFLEALLKLGEVEWGVLERGCIY